ncbi:MAG: dipeptidase [Christensenellaceae bacterium]|jgi:membrane dipeptidase|nr:dipeptidase [Christensenellaceae bacterium]
MNAKTYPVVDLHCDTLTCAIALSNGKSRLAQSAGQVDLPRLFAGGAMLQGFAIFAPAQPVEGLLPVGNTPRALFDASYSWYQRELSEQAARIAPILRYADIPRAGAGQKLGALLTLEDGALCTDTAALHTLYAKGVRMMALCWNFPNALGFPNSPNPQAMARGLTPWGKEAVRRMQGLGIVVDISHLSDGGFYDVAALCDKPFIASHSNARAVCDHPRNLSDAMLRALAGRGGITGLNFYSVLVNGSGYTAAADIVRHALHIRNVAGIEALAFGSDFDGSAWELEFADCAGYPALLREMERHFTPRELDLISHQNALRVLRECME